jgi:hypothetical protein
MIKALIQKKITFLQTSRWAIIATITGIILLFLWVLYIIFSPSFLPNYAQESAKPLEKSFIEAGARKVAEGSDPGRGPDTSSPRYDATFEIDKNRADTIQLIQKVSANNGFKLTHTTPDNRGFLWGFDDADIDNWYFDNTSKKSLHRDLDDGPLELAFRIGDTDTQAQPDQTRFMFKIKLPEFK